jgi:agmatine/peptidylarginine deiminase
MGDFFKSELVREELKEINELQHSIYENGFSFDKMDHDERIEHIDNLSTLLELQRVMYTRLSLSDDPEAKKMKKQLEKSVQMLGFPAGTDISVLFSGMTQTIESLKSKIDE